eukprot:14021787-Alexandrium_andersonii.AAC.1
MDVVALFLLTIESDKSRSESGWVIGAATAMSRPQGPECFPPGQPRLNTVEGRMGEDVVISPLLMRVTQGHSAPWIQLG